MTLKRYVRAVLLVTAVAFATAALPVAAATSKPTPHPIPTPTPSPPPPCSIPAGLEGDPTEQKLFAQCQAERARIDTQKGKLSDSLALAKGSSESLKAMLVQTKASIEQNRAQQDQTRIHIADIKVRESETAMEMAATRARLALKRRQYASFLRRSYKGSSDLWIALFDSHGLSEFMTRAAAVVQIQAYGRDLLTAIHTEALRLDDQAARLAEDHKSADQQQAQLVASQQQLVNDDVREAAILSALNQSIGDGEKELANASQQTADLVAKIVAAQVEREDQLIQMANEAAWQTAQAWLANNQAIFPSSGGHSTKYPFIWPVSKGVLTQGFGPTDYAPEPPLFGAAHFHAGIDIANSSGTPIQSADDGIVVAAEDSLLGGHLIGYGRHVIIAGRNGTLALYGHLDGYIVKVGDKVTQGQVVGFMGSTGMSSGPHLHFEVRLQNSPVDPKPYLPPNGPNDYHQ